MAVEAPNTTGPFIAVIFILILLPFSFAVYSFYNSRVDRQLEREERRRAAQAAAANTELVRPVLWEAWTEPAGKNDSVKSCDALGSWKSIQPLWAKAEVMLPERMTQGVQMAVESAAPGHSMGEGTRGEMGRDRLSRFSLWWYLGLLAPTRPNPTQIASPLKTRTGDAFEEEDSDIWKHNNSYQLQIGVVVALPSAPGNGSNGKSPDARVGGNVEGNVDCSTGYCIGTASCPIRIDAG